MIRHAVAIDERRAKFRSVAEHTPFADDVV